MQHLAGLHSLQIDGAFVFFFSRDGFFAAARFVGTVLLTSCVRGRIVQGSRIRIKPFFLATRAGASAMGIDTPFVSGVLYIFSVIF
jgi:hypothetical protein